MCVGAGLSPRGDANDGQASSPVARPVRPFSPDPRSSPCPDAFGVERNLPAGLTRAALDPPVTIPLPERGSSRRRTRIAAGGERSADLQGRAEPAGFGARGRARSCRRTPRPNARARSRTIGSRRRGQPSRSCSRKHVRTAGSAPSSCNRSAKPRKTRNSTGPSNE
jgi:hypothetical protein